MAKQKGCAVCRKPTEALMQYEATTLVGQQFIAFICHNCIPLIRKQLEEMTAGKRISAVTALGQEILQH